MLGEPQASVRNLSVGNGVETPLSPLGCLHLGHRHSSRDKVVLMVSGVEAPHLASGASASLRANETHRRLPQLATPLAIWKLQYRCAGLGLIAVSPLLVALRPGAGFVNRRPLWLWPDNPAAIAHHVSAIEA
jgi:hypothetical protein